MITILVEPFKTHQDKIKIIRKWDNKAKIEIFETYVMLTIRRSEYEKDRFPN